MKIDWTLKGARQRLGAWNDARKEKAAERAAAKAHDAHAHSRFWLLNVPALATVCAAVVEWYWAVLFCIEATGQLGMDWSTSVGSDTAATGAWHFVFDIQSVAVLLGLVLATMPIVMLSMIWLPVQFAMRGAGRVRRGSLIAVGILANVLVIVSGTVVMNYNRQDQVREDLVVEQTAEAQRAMLVANVDDLRAELDTLMNHRSTYVATAASVGAVAYERDYVQQARATNDPRLPLLERALGSARRADELRSGIVAARRDVAAAAPAAASQATVEDTVGRELNTFAQYVEVWRPPFVAFICTLIGIFGAWWTLAMLERLNPRDVLRSGWADESHRIEDLREQEAVTPQPMRPAREVVTDAETGEELVKVKPREYWRKRKGKPQKVEFTPEVPPDETGVEYDGGGRAASVADETADAPSADRPEDQADHAESREESQGLVEQQQEGAITQADHPEPPQFALSEEDEAAFREAEPELFEPPQAVDEITEPQADPAVFHDAQQDEAVEEQAEHVEQDEPDHVELTDREPETRADRLLAAE